MCRCGFKLASNSEGTASRHAYPLPLQYVKGAAVKLIPRCLSSPPVALPKKVSFRPPPSAPLLGTAPRPDFGGAFSATR